MKHLCSRVRFIGASAFAVAGLGIVRFPGEAAEFTYKIALDKALGDPMTVQLQAMVEKLKTDTGGRIELQLFPNSVLGGDPAMLEQFRVGAIPFLVMPDNVLANLVPVAAISNMAFAFESDQQAFASMDGALGRFIRSEIFKAGIYAYPRMWDNGSRQMTTSTHPIVTPEDLVGVKMRVPESPIAIAMFKAFGATPAAINTSEFYTALQTHIVDGQENALSVVEDRKFYEVQKYVSLTNHMWAGYWFLARAQILDGMPKDLRAAFDRNVEASTALAREATIKRNAELQPRLTAQGMTFNTVVREPFRKKLREAGFYADQKQRYSAQAWALLERSVGKLT